MGKDFCIINVIGKDACFEDFYLVVVVLLALLALLMSPEIGRNSCLRHAIASYFALNY